MEAMQRCGYSLKDAALAFSCCLLVHTSHGVMYHCVGCMCMQVAHRQSALGTERKAGAQADEELSGSRHPCVREGRRPSAPPFYLSCSFTLCRLQGTGFSAAVL